MEMLEEILTKELDISQYLKLMVELKIHELER